MAGLSCTVTWETKHTCKISSSGPLYPTKTTPGPRTKEMQDKGFWAHLEKMGGGWMWEDIKNTSSDMRWVVNPLVDGTGIMVTDGSYVREMYPDISGAGWILFCTRTGNKISGSF